jgi:hypothetical protein
MGSSGWVGEGKPREPGPRERKVLYRGSEREIVCATLADGSWPAWDYLESLSSGDQARFMALFVLMGDMGRIKNDEKFHPKVHAVKCQHDGRITEFPVGEFKVHSGPGRRMMACLDGREWVLTHGFTKGSKIPTEGKRAGRIFCEDRSIRLREQEREGHDRGHH